MTFDLNTHICRLLMAEPFFAALSRKIDKRATTTVKTAGVRINEETAQFEMVYNPDFFESLTDIHRLGVLKHEFYHLVYGHVTNRLPEGKMTLEWNQATDLAINSTIPNELPETCLLPGRDKFEHLPLGMSAEWYLKAIKKDKKAKADNKKAEEDNKKEEEEKEDDVSLNGPGSSDDGEEEKEDKKEDSDSGDGAGGSGSGDGEEEEQDSFDDHSGWGEATPETKEIAKQRIKEIIKQAADEADEKGNWGSVSSQVRKDIREALTTKLDWRKVLRYFVKTSERANKSSSVKKINRRYAYIHPGKKVSRQARIAISIDQSGSVNDEMLEVFYAELNKLSTIAEFTVIPFDHQVFEEKVYVWKKGEKKKKERVLCGGTCFNAPTDYVNKHGFDGHIVLTDMYAPKPKASKCQRMWMTTEYCASRPYFQTNERVIAVVK